MLAFRRAAGTAALSNFWDNGDNQVAFARDRRAFVVLNAESSELRREFATGLPEGRYCDVVPGLPGDDCVGASFEVDGSGRAQISVPALGAVALFVGASR